MSSHVFHEIYLHLTWHTNDDRPLLTHTIEAQVHDLLRDRCRKTKGVYLHAVNGTANHIHLAMNIEPHVTISVLVGELKGGSAHDLNQEVGQKRPEWQRGFGVVSFGKKQLPWVLEYIARQKEHHVAGSTHDRLERADLVEDEDSPEGRTEAG